MRIGFDIDGVLTYTTIGEAVRAVVSPFQPAHRHIAQRAVFYEEAIEFLLTLERMEHEIYLISGRPDTTLEETKLCMVEAGLNHLTDKVFLNPKRSVKLEDMIAHKKRMIKKHRIKIYVDDHPKIAQALMDIPKLAVVLHEDNWVDTTQAVWRLLAQTRWKHAPKTKEEFRNWEFEHPAGGSSTTPKMAFDWREEKEKDPETWDSLADIVHKRDEYYVGEVLGKYCDFGGEVPNMLWLVPKIRAGKEMKVYRASDVGHIIPGSYVTESLAYAKMHGRCHMPTGSKWRIYSQYVWPDELFSYGDAHEFLYVPRNLDIAYERYLGHAKENPQWRVVISVPHAVGNKKNHGLDVISVEMALKLAAELNVPPENIVIGDMPRDVVDLNRRKARDSTDYRFLLKRAIMRGPENTILLDVHSFHRASDVYGDYDVAIATADAIPQPYERALCDWLKEHDVRSAVVCRRIMDIVPQARRLGVPVALLLEFRESSTPAKRKAWAKLVTEFFQHFE